MQVQKELRNAGSSLGESKRAFPRGGQRAAAKGQGRASQEFRSDAEEELILFKACLEAEFQTF